jgi:hypothetical protein
LAAERQSKANGVVDELGDRHGGLGGLHPKGAMQCRIQVDGGSLGQRHAKHNDAMTL